ncbi:MAG: hypothetical protein GTO42_01475 [Candidatus Latescibacteria bacterium]|nr:hypothetical protein [Candidatus Latescibacterota bacterium]NIO27200.1 hypothetical protein [Candidatus Latescibacterota bacterium]NIO54724.1 hypothetical protein [Candidatus Latescibacterota bacterium]NIT00807.1 hypothetical protein [Candidatus Latescibacterota bacterium]NIT37730.1 hypothetical protein [Candidatus Latescibacterota bacterium]
MKRLLLLGVVVLFISTVSFAQGGLIGLYIDPWGDDCDIEDCKVEIINVYVVHKFAPSPSACQFMIVSSDGFTGAYLGEETPLMNGCMFGNSQRGISIAYGECASTPVHILTLRYYLYGTSKPNSYLQVVGDPTNVTPGIYIVDCTTPPTLIPAIGGRAYINGDGTVSCSTTPVEPTSWGRIKSLYK